MYDFNNLAELYSTNTIEIPKQYVDLIINTFDLSSKDKVLDIGCGAGSIALPLSKVIIDICGIDKSIKMIEIARRKDYNNNIHWIVGDVFDQNFKANNYKLILIYETLHLFSSVERLMKKIIPAIQYGGYLCMGFCVYNWEKIIYEDIIQVLERNGIHLDNWFFQDTEKFKNSLEDNHNINMSKMKEKSIEVNQIWTAESIAQYITSISIFASCSRYKAKKIQDEITTTISAKYGNIFDGYSQYYIRYAQKVSQDNTQQFNNIS